MGLVSGKPDGNGEEPEVNTSIIIPLFKGGQEGDFTSEKSPPTALNEGESKRRLHNAIQTHRI